MSLGKLLGKGTYSRIYLSKDGTSAIKIIDYSDDNLTCFESTSTREIHFLHSLRHPNILKSLGTTFEEHCIYVKLELCKYPLSKRMYSTVLMFSDILKYSFQLLSAIVYLHSQKISHRDINPNNILIDDDNNIKLIDFNLSKEILPHGSGANSPRVVTVFWRAPEILFMDNARYDPFAIDMWSVGCIFHEFLRSKELFSENSNSQKTIRNIHNTFFERCDTPNYYKNSTRPSFQQDENFGNYTKLISNILKKEASERYTAQQAFDEILLFEGVSETLHSGNVSKAPCDGKQTTPSEEVSLKGEVSSTLPKGTGAIIDKAITIIFNNKKINPTEMKNVFSMARRIAKKYFVGMTFDDIKSKCNNVVFCAVVIAIKYITDFDKYNNILELLKPPKYSKWLERDIYKKLECVLR